MAFRYCGPRQPAQTGDMDVHRALAAGCVRPERRDELMARVDVHRTGNEIGKQVELQLGQFELTPRDVHRAGIVVDLDGVLKVFGRRGRFGSFGHATGNGLRLRRGRKHEMNLGGCLAHRDGDIPLSREHPSPAGNRFDGHRRVSWRPTRHRVPSSPIGTVCCESACGHWLLIPIGACRADVHVRRRVDSGAANTTREAASSESNLRMVEVATPGARIRDQGRGGSPALPACHQRRSPTCTVSTGSSHVSRR